MTTPSGKDKKVKTETQAQPTTRRVTEENPLKGTPPVLSFPANTQWPGASLAAALALPSPSLSLAEIPQMSKNLLEKAAKNQSIITSFLKRNKELSEKMPAPDSQGLGEAFSAFMKQVAAHPDILVEANIAFSQGYVQLLQNVLARTQGRTVAPVIAPEAGDRRFKDEEWQTNWVFDFVKEFYLLWTRWISSLLVNAQELEPHTRHKVEFYTKQLVDALAPSNFWMTHPEALRAAFETGGQSLLNGFDNFLTDMDASTGMIRVKMSDHSAFKFGENIAITKGKVVFQNELFQLIQYAPLTETVHKTPLLIVPPWINKYYILDLKPENSLIRYLVEQGHTVFCMSWANPDERHANIGFEDYMMLGPVTAATEIAKITGENKLNCVGYCIGGTLLATMMGWLASAGNKKPAGMPEVASTTYFVSLIDFSQPGDLGVFIDEKQIQMMEALMKERGFLPGSSLATTFSMLRANDLIWSFVTNNYLLGKQPAPFDLLTWNSDSTNMPATMQSYYLRNMYLENNLIKPNKLEMKGVPIDLRKVKTPAFCISTVEDHITLWRATYTATQTYSGPVTFCLSGSGHIAGIVNPPAKKKYGYWTNPNCPPNPDDWLKAAEKHEGSWWPEWMKWLEPHTGGKVPARDPASNQNVIEDAPGSYVRVKGL